MTFLIILSLKFQIAPNKVMNVILWTKLFVYNHVTKTKFSQFYLFYAHVTMIIRQTKVELFKLISIFI